MVLCFFCCSFAFGELKLMEGSQKLSPLLLEMRINTSHHPEHSEQVETGDDPEMVQIAKEEEEWF